MVTNYDNCEETEDGIFNKVKKWLKLAILIKLIKLDRIFLQNFHNSWQLKDEYQQKKWWLSVKIVC